MKYPTLLLGLVTLMASPVAATAQDTAVNRDHFTEMLIVFGIIALFIAYPVIRIFNDKKYRDQCHREALRYKHILERDREKLTRLAERIEKEQG